MNRHHARIAGFVIDRANDRTSKPFGREAKAERAKEAATPMGRLLQPDADDRPDTRNIPQSSWGSIERNKVLNSGYHPELDTGFSFSKKL